MASSSAARPIDTSTTEELPVVTQALANGAPLNCRTTRRKRLDSGGELGPELIVLKVGTSTLMASDADGQRVQLANVARLVDLIGVLKRTGYDVILVSSGAVGMGCIKLGLAQKPTSVRTKQAVAAAGQSHLMQTYEALFATVRLKAAQLLISQSDFLDKSHWGNVRSTIRECLRLGLVPIINENDSTNTEELRFGDNDNLAAMTAVQMEADWLFLFTDVDYLYSSNPRTDPNAEALRVVRQPWALSVDTKSAGGGFGTGGMTTKIIAARTASSAGIVTGLIHGAHPERIHSFLKYDISKASSEAELPGGTYFAAMDVVQTVSDTRRWILSLPIAGDLLLDDGAARAVGQGKSLLPAGIIQVRGTFQRGEAVRITHRGEEVARAIVNFASDELTKIKGLQSSEFEEVLGFGTCHEASHRGNIILTTSSAALRGLSSIEGGGSRRRGSNMANKGRTNQALKRNTSEPDCSLLAGSDPPSDDAGTSSRELS